MAPGADDTFPYCPAILIRFVKEPLMKRVFGLALLGLVLAVPAPVRADGPVDGNWRLTVVNLTGTAEATNWLLKFETTDGRTTATLLAASPAYKGPELTSFKLQGDAFRAVVKYGAVELTFLGQVSKDGKKIIGVLGNDQV